MDGDSETLSIVSSSLGICLPGHKPAAHCSCTKVLEGFGLCSTLESSVVALNHPSLSSHAISKKLSTTPRASSASWCTAAVPLGGTECVGCWGASTLSPEAAKAVAVTLVESVCPDAAGAELAWPPEEHARATVERDLRIGSASGNSLCSLSC